MPLLDELESVRARLGKIKSARADVDEAQRLADLRLELEDTKRKVEPVVRSIALLRANRIQVTKIAVGNALSRLAAVSEKFEANPVSSSLKTGSRWTQLISSLETAFAEANVRRDAGWKDFVSTLYSGSTPEQLEAQLARTPQNISALETYRKLHASYTALRRSPVSTSETLAQLLSLSDDLGKIKFDHQVTKEVKMFLEASATSGGFPLSDLSMPVIEWLKENNLITNYIVRQRPQ